MSMKMGREVAVLIACLLALIALASVHIAEATDYNVGDNKGWTGPPNIGEGFYNNWAANKTFKGGDSLTFVWNGNHTVANVTKQEYDNCTKVDSYFAGGAAFTFKLPSDANGTYYFMCTIDSHCEGGQKFAINVTSSETSTNDDGSSGSLAVGALWAILSTGALFHLIN